MSYVNLMSYSDTSYHNEELKSLTRYRFDKVNERAKHKTSISRLICILFPELDAVIEEIENEIKIIMNEKTLQSLVFPGIAIAWVQ